MAFETQLPPGVVAGSVSVVIPTPFRFSVARTAGKLVVEGAVADADAAGRLRDAIGRLYGLLPVDVRLTPTADLPPVAEGIALVALRAASELADGSVSVTDGDVAVDGVALTARSLDRLSEDLAALPDGYSARNTVAGPPPPVTVTADACQRSIDALARSVAVPFNDRDDASP